MPKPLFTAEQKAEIARRYQAGETQAEIAADFNCFPATIGKQLKKLGIAARPKKAARKSGRRECPFSAETLEHLYWQQGLALAEIALRAQEEAAWDTSPSDAVVYRWFRAAKVRMRTRGEAQSLTLQRHRQAGTGPYAFEAKQAVREAVERRWQPVFVGGKIVRPVNRGHKWTAAHRKHFSEIAKERRGAFRVTRRCENVLCTKTFVVPSYSGQRFCSAACNYASHRKRVETRCAQCGKVLFRVPSRIGRGSSGLDFCGQACNAAYTSRGRKFPDRPKKDCTCGQMPHASRCPVYKREWAARKRAEKEAK